MVVTVRGDFDAANAGVLRNALADVVDPKGTRSVVVDLAGVTFIDSKGVRALVGGMSTSAPEAGS